MEISGSWPRMLARTVCCEKSVKRNGVSKEKYKWRGWWLEGHAEQRPAATTDAENVTSHHFVHGRKQCQAEMKLPLRPRHRMPRTPDKRCTVTATYRGPVSFTQ